ncbi:hypothetical protein FCM35_KLT04686 [Carex littledalei]|uniref:Uncharacterized protein n=1 Tax=Carex littledalei TaxID=544730 RepID=A0A833VJX4_9POAL|nr:hypothetical protein FCM35_KLT04686 [Carex littledalei]
MILVVAFLCLSYINSVYPYNDNITAYEMLEKYNFPKGILPTGVQSYKLSPNGEFEVLLKSDCKFKVVGGYLLNYDNRISGKVEIGALKSLNGVKVRIFFIWIEINEVVRSNADLNFYVGPMSASFSTSSFEECPRCNSQFVDGNGGVIETI